MAAVDPAPVLRRTVAVLVSRFPTVTETFIQHEIDEMERQGQPVLLVPLLRDTPSMVHDQARMWMPRALFTPFLSPGIVAANLRVSTRHPIRYGTLLVRLVAGTIARPSVLVRTLALFPKSVYLAEELRAAEVGHVHAHFATYPATAALIIAALTDITFSFTAHAHDIFVDRALLGLKIARAEFVRVVSQFNAAFLTSRYRDAIRDKLRVIHMGIPIPVAERRARGKRPGEPRLLCVAALKPYKGVHRLVEACQHLRDAGVTLQCDVVGDGPERAQLQRQIARAKLGDVVRLRGARLQSDVAALLRQASVFVLPSIVARNGQMEGIPVALMEAMGAGVPVVASALSGVPELVEDGVSGLLVEPDDAHALAGALRRLIEDPDLGRALAAAGRRVVARDFRLERTVADLVAEVDRHNLELPAEVRRAVSRSSPHEAGDMGCRRIRESRDACVVEVVTSDRTEPRECVVKIARSRAGESAPAAERARREYATLVLLHHLLRGMTAEPAPIRLSVPRPLTLDEAYAAVWLERCTGRRLDHVVRALRFRRDPDGWAQLREHFQSTGRWLRHFQHHMAYPREPDAVQQTLVAQATAALGASGLSARARQQVHDRLVFLAAQLRGDARRVVGRHGDFWPGNIFVADGSVQVIDFEGFGPGLPCEDVGWFLVTLDLLLAHPFLQRRRVDLATAFLSGFQDGDDPLDPAALHLGRTAAAARLAARLDPTNRRWHRALRSVLVAA